MTDKAEQARQRDEHIKKLVEAAPPLTQEQRARLAVLLHPPAAPAPDLVEQVRRTRREQGLPPTVEDPAVLDQVANILATPAPDIIEEI